MFKMKIGQSSSPVHQSSPPIVYSRYSSYVDVISYYLLVPLLADSKSTSLNAAQLAVSIVVPILFISILACLTVAMIVLCVIKCQGKKQLLKSNSSIELTENLGKILLYI